MGVMNYGLNHTYGLDQRQDRLVSGQKIKERAEVRGISYLLHFTRVENLGSILRFGLLSRVEAKKKHITPFVTDNQRYDGKLHGISLSIEHPNHKMFYSKRMIHGPSKKWVVLVLRPEILWEKDCAFYKHNAADSRMSRLPLQSLKGCDAFESMFSNEFSRKQQGLKDNQVTDVQAEVLALESIETTYLHGVAFEDEWVRRTYGQQLNRMGIVNAVYRPFYGKREWQQ